jgi:hypothetical protein
MPEKNKNKKKRSFNRPGNVLIADQFNNRVVETAPDGQIVWSFGRGPNDFTAQSIIGVNDAERIGTLTLMTGTGTPANLINELPVDVPAPDNRVILVDRSGKIVWQYGQFRIAGSGFNLLNTPVQSTFIPCSRHHCKHLCGQSSILITDQGNNRVILVNKKKNVIWQYPVSNTAPQDLLNSPNSAQKLKNGNYLIADENNNRAVEISRSHKIVKIFTANGTLGACAFASRLPDGHTLLTDATNNRIVEVNRHDIPVWQYITNTEPLSIPNPTPTRGLRLKNGDTLISDQFNNRVIRISGLTGISGAEGILAYYGLPLTGAVIPPNNIIGTNKGYDPLTTQLGLYAPYDAKIIGDYTGLTDIN